MAANQTIVTSFAEAAQVTSAVAATLLAEIATAIWDDASGDGTTHDRARMLELMRSLARGDTASLARLALALPHPEADARAYLMQAAASFIAQSEADAADGLEPANSVWVEVGHARSKPLPDAGDLPPLAGGLSGSVVLPGEGFRPSPPPAFSPALAPTLAPKSGGGMFGRILSGISLPGFARAEPPPDLGLGDRDFQLGTSDDLGGIESLEPGSDPGLITFDPWDEPAAAASEEPLAPPDAQEFRVWFGTNRKPKAGDKLAFGNTRDRAVSYGYCDVYVPDSHKIGEIGSSFIRRFVTRTDDRLKLVQTCALGAEAYWTLLKSQLAATPEGKRHAVVFIHGYNVAFGDAALRAAQIGYDLGIEGAMAFFSWPSKGTLGGYQADQQTIEASEPAITQFLVDFARNSGADAVHVIAHSMGNRGVLRAVSRIVQDAEQRTGVEFANFILAAPDVDAETFANLAGAYAKLGKRTTLYVSQTDLAVGFSKLLSQYPRVGYAPPVTVVEGIDTINVTNVDVTLLGHGYVADARPILTDMHALIFEDSPPPAERFGLRARSTPGGEAYWEVGA
jgi:esterase/lipase superfamily enzyme